MVFFSSIRKLAILIGAFVVFLFLVLFLSGHSRANTKSWAINDPYILIGTEEIKSQYLMPGNRSCQNKTLQTFVYKESKDKAPTETPVEQCVTTNQLGTFGGSYLSPNANYSYKTVYQNLSHSIVGVPNQPIFFVIRPSQSAGVNMHLYRDVGSSGTFEDLRVLNKYSGIVYKFDSITPALKDSTNKIISFHEFAFSENGEWMVAEIPGVGLLRINLLMEEKTLFSDEKFNRGQGYPVDVTLAISNDGRYALKSGRNAGATKIYDISGCQNTGNFDIYIRSTIGCSSRDVTQLVKSNIGGLAPSDIVFLHSMRFSSDNNSVNGVVLKGPESGAKIAKKITLSLDPISENKDRISYVAMGDSFASGEGDMDDSWYEDGTNVYGQNLCHLSKRSYPYLLASDLEINEFHSVACSGARTYNILSVIQYAKSDVSRGLLRWTPGSLEQNKFLDIESLGTPSFITLSIGGNDLGFASILTDCVTSRGECDHATSDRERSNVAISIASEYKNLKSTYEEIIYRTKSQTKLYVVGYPQFVKRDGLSCGVNTPLNGGELEFISKSTHYTNQVIKAAAEAAGAYYIDFEDALENRNLCSDIPDSEMVVNGVTEGDDKFRFINTIKIGGAVYTKFSGLGNESFHPNQNGHKLLRNVFLEKTNGDPIGFAVCTDASMKICPKGSAIPSPDEYFGPEAISYVASLNKGISAQVTISKQKVFLSDGIYESRTVKIIQSGLASSSIVRVEIHSEPVSLGSYTTNSRGEINVELKIPDSVPPGFHEIHIFGKNIANEPVDYFQRIFISGPENDLNYNGIADHLENTSCGLVVASEADYDKDGVDDACDGYIGEPPAPPPQEEAPAVDAPEIINDVTELPDIISTPGETGPEGPDDRDDDIIPGVNPTNTNSAQGQQNGSNLQSGGTQAQTTAGGLQTGATTNISGDGNTLEYLSTSSTSRPLSVGVASAGTSTASTTPAAKDTGMSSWVLWVLAIAFALAAIWLYKKFMKNSPPEKPEETPVELSAVANYVKVNKPKKDKKHKKKKKKPHHH